MITRHSIRLAALGLFAASLLTACGSDDAGEATGQSATGDDGPVLATAETDFGTVLVDGDGQTLYLFTQDSPGTSVCEADCLAAWPPFEGEPAAGEGVDEGLIGSIERSDGTTQATYDEWPLYYFAQDSSAGDVSGQGVNDVWYVVSPDGEAIMEAPADTGGSGY